MDLQDFFLSFYFDGVCSLQQSSINLFSFACFYGLCQTVFGFVYGWIHVLEYARLFFQNIMYTSVTFNNLDMKFTMEKRKEEAKGQAIKRKRKRERKRKR